MTLAAGTQKERHLQYADVFLFGMSGDTELFENPSNIKDLWAYEQRIILYFPYLVAAALKQPPFS